MAIVDAYWAEPCGGSGGGDGWYVLKSVVDSWSSPTSLGVVRVQINPDVFRCCSIDRSQKYEVDSSQTKQVAEWQGSCQACVAQWEGG